jgi:predicted DNA-binding transcriptional regulator AlpA
MFIMTYLSPTRGPLTPYFSSSCPNLNNAPTKEPGRLLWVIKQENEQMNWIETKDVLAMCRMSRRTLYDLLRANEFPPPVILGKRKRRWREDDVRAWMAAQ